MKPKSFSATAMHVAELCLARYGAEQIHRARGTGNVAADLGTAVHGALELYVQTVYLKEEQEPSEKYLLDLFKLSYAQTFGVIDTSTEEYKDGVAMLKAWFKRTDFSLFKVLSCEVKESFPIKTSIGEIPFNYIWDRADQLDDKEYRVVDYKTNRWGIRPDDLKKKLQARAYALAAQIKWKDAERIWVEFDMLRHDGPVGIVFTREENAATWRRLKAKAQEIVDTPDGDLTPLEKLNAECLFCVRLQACSQVKKNKMVGGIMTIASVEEGIDMRAQLEWQKKAVEAAINQIDSMIMTDAQARDEFEFESEDNKLFITASSNRAVDGERALMVLGPELFAKYGSQKMTMATVDKLLKGDELTPEQKSQLKSLIYNKRGEPRVKVESKTLADED